MSRLCYYYFYYISIQILDQNIGLKILYLPIIPFKSFTLTPLDLHSQPPHFTQVY